MLVKMNSKFLLLAVAGLFAVGILFTSSFVETAFAKDFDLTYDAFHHSSSIFVDDKLVFSTLEKTRDNLPGTISAVDTKTGELLYKIKSPHQNMQDDWFANHIVSVGSNIATGSISPNLDSQKWISSVHVFDGNNGSLLYTIDNPVSDSMFFGSAFASIGNYLAVYASDEDPNDDKHGNMVHVFDGNDGSLLYTIDNPNTYGDFGGGLATLDDKLLVAVSDRNGEKGPILIHSFDIENGELLYTIEHSQQLSHADTNHGMFLIAGDSLVARSDDAMFIYDGNTGELLHTEDGFPTTNNELQMILYSIGGGDDGYDDSLVILVVGIALGVIVTSVVLFKRMKK